MGLGDNRLGLPPESSYEGMANGSGPRVRVVVRVRVKVKVGVRRGAAKGWNGSGRMFQNRVTRITRAMEVMRGLGRKCCSVASSEMSPLKGYHHGRLRGIQGI